MSGIEIYVSTLGLVLFLPKTLIDIIKKLKNERRDKIILNSEGLLVVLMCGKKELIQKQCKEFNYEGIC